MRGGHGLYGVGSHNSTPHRPSIGGSTDHNHDPNPAVKQRSSSMYSIGNVGLSLEGLSLSLDHMGDGSHGQLPPPPPPALLSVHTQGSLTPTADSEPTSPLVTPLPDTHTYHPPPPYSTISPNQHTLSTHHFPAGRNKISRGGFFHWDAWLCRFTHKREKRSHPPGRFSTKVDPFHRCFCPTRA